MKLSSHQQRSLALYLKFKDIPPTILQLFAFNLRIYIPLLFIMSLGIFFLSQ